MRFTARWRSATVSQRGCRISTNSWSGNWASSACTRRAAVSPVEPETMWSSTLLPATLSLTAGGYRRDTQGPVCMAQTSLCVGTCTCVYAPLLAGASARNLREIAEHAEAVAELEQQAQPIRAG